jgi:hypothetical protein
MRIRKYRCPSSSFEDQCLYEGFFEVENQPCVNCGKTYEETRTIFDQIESIYCDIVPYEWRPKQMWYYIKSRFWLKQKIVNPRYLSYGYHDPVALLPHAMFEVLCNFVERELGPDCYVDWDYTPEHSHAYQEFMSLYKWWKEVQQKKLDGDIDCGYTSEEEYEEALNKNLQRMLAVRPYMWT